MIYNIYHILYNEVYHANLINTKCSNQDFYKAVAHSSHVFVEHLREKQS